MDGGFADPDAGVLVAQGRATDLDFVVAVGNRNLLVRIQGLPTDSKTENLYRPSASSSVAGLGKDISFGGSRVGGRMAGLWNCGATGVARAVRGGAGGACWHWSFSEYQLGCGRLVFGTFLPDTARAKG